MKWLRVTWGESGNFVSQQKIYSREEWDRHLARPLSGPEVRFSVPCDPAEPARRFAALFHRHVLASSRQVAWEDGWLTFAFDYACADTWEGSKREWVRLVKRTCSLALPCHPMGAGRPEAGFEEPPDRSEVERVGTVPLFAEDLDSLQLGFLGAEDVTVEVTEELIL